jgi:hypothetical protein
MSDHMQVTELLGAYALDALENAETQRVRAHLAECAICREQLASLSETSGQLADLMSGPLPPAELRGRVLAAVENEARPPQPASGPLVTARRLRWAGAFTAIALIVSQGWLIITLVSLRSNLDQQSRVQAILLSSDEAPIKVMPADPASPARGIYRYEPDLRWGLLNYYQLPALDADQSYECWMEFASAPARPCGRLSVGVNGTGIVVITWPASEPTQIRVTQETGVVSSPTGPTILSGDILPGLP